MSLILVDTGRQRCLDEGAVLASTKDEAEYLHVVDVLTRSLYSTRHFLEIRSKFHYACNVLRMYCTFYSELPTTKSYSIRNIMVHVRHRAYVVWLFHTPLRVNKGCALVILFQVRSLYVSIKTGHLYQIPFLRHF